MYFGCNYIQLNTVLLNELQCTKQSGPGCLKLNKVVSQRDLKISILKYGNYTAIFYSHFYSKNIDAFENSLATKLTSLSLTSSLS